MAYWAGCLDSDGAQLGGVYMCVGGSKGCVSSAFGEGLAQILLDDLARSCNAVILSYLPACALVSLLERFFSLSFVPWGRWSIFSNITSSLPPVSHPLIKLTC